MSSTRSRLDDELLLRLVGRSPALENLGVRGSTVTPEGLAALVQGEGARGGGGSGRGGGGKGSGGGMRVVEDEDHEAGVAGEGEEGPEQQQPAVAAVAAVAAARPAVPVASLEVTQGTLCSDDGLEVIGQLLAPTLRVLWAQHGGAQVSDAGLARLHLCEVLEELDVSGSAVTDQGG
jgi:hypothetical protein